MVGEITLFGSDRALTVLSFETTCFWSASSNLTVSLRIDLVSRADFTKVARVELCLHFALLPRQLLQLPTVTLQSGSKLIVFLLEGVELSLSIVLLLFATLELVLDSFNFFLDVC